MLLNFSNHPVDKWTEEQLSQANEIYGDVVDIAFPAVNPEATENEIIEQAKNISDNISEALNFSKDKRNAVHAMGEFSLCFAVVSILIKSGIECVCSTSKRISEEIEDGRKIISFEFVRFRKYMMA